MSFISLRTLVLPSPSLDIEVNKRIGKATSTLADLPTQVWTNPKLTVKTKMCVISTLLYDSETWTTYGRQERRLNTSHLRSNLHILGISWQDRVSNTAVPSRTGLPSMHTLLSQQRLRWLGHIHFMEGGHIPKDIHNGELASGKRTTGSPQLCYKDVCMRDMKLLDIVMESRERFAADHMRWRSILNQHLKTAENKL
ncbi:hypothetical protein chiPu_0002973 [Chiloscyllium punctatum]|uniref:Uncharacterized protein n=1 Tax=Chiloscyllium punctatum TaxID=137246 RepID=A0A401S2E8_CHIPU|nr:hypothetical protein [Chiloscyllium punctatum]